MKIFDSDSQYTPELDAEGLPPNQADNTHTLPPASRSKLDLVLCKVPVEIWYQILECVIAPLYVLDTTLESNGCHWWSRDRYHDRKIYACSEVEREKLRLVCRGWAKFADNNKWRWLRYNPRSNAWDAGHLKGAVERAVTTRNDPDADTSSRSTVMLKRLTIHIDSNSAQELFCKTIEHISSKLTILFVDCTKKYGTPVLEHLLANSHLLPCLRCLMLTHVDFRNTPLQDISTAFPLLTGLTFLSGIVPHNSNDRLHLPQLESLYIGKVNLGDMRPQNWYIPALLRLLISINEDEGPEVTFRLVKALGASLVLLRVDTNLQHFSVGADIWTSCPRLTELVIRLSAVEFLAPIPVGHPLRYVINKDTEDARGKVSLRLRFQNNIIALGDKVEVIIMTSLSWKDHIANRPQEDTYLEKMSRLLGAKGTQLQDMEGRTMDDYLQMALPLTQENVGPSQPQIKFSVE